MIGNFARHQALKGQEYLLRAFATFASRHREAVLLMVGDGPHGVCLRQLAAELGLVASGQTIFTGWRREGWKILEAVHVVVHPTLSEALPAGDGGDHGKGQATGHHQRLRRLRSCAPYGQRLPDRIAQ